MIKLITPWHFDTNI